MNGSAIRILDLGCGHGTHAEELLARGELFGIDPDRRTVAGTGSRYPAGRFCAMSAERLAFRDDSFHELHAYDVLEHIDDLDAALGEVSRVLAPGARVVVEVPHSASETVLARIHPGYFEQSHHQRLLTPTEWLAALNRHGVRVERVAHRKLFESLCLAYFFARGRPVRNQQGELGSYGDSRPDDRVVETLLELTLLSPQSLAGRWPAPERVRIEGELGMTLVEASALVRAVESTGARFFAKTVRFEGTFAGRVAPQEWARIEREPLPAGVQTAIDTWRRDWDAVRRELEAELERRRCNEEELSRSLDERVAEVKRLVGQVEERQEACDWLAQELRNSEAARSEVLARYERDMKEQSEARAGMVEDVARLQKVNADQHAELVAMSEKVAELVAAYEERQAACDRLVSELDRLREEARFPGRWLRRRAAAVQGLFGGGDAAEGSSGQNARKKDA